MTNLKDEAEQQGLQLKSSAKLSSWRGRIQSVLTRALGADHHLTKAFIDTRFTFFGPISTSTPKSTWDNAFLSGLQEATGVLEAAIFELELAGTSDDAVDETAFDPDLWAHVQTDVQNEEWQKVASQTAIFVEDRVRQWCDSPKGKNDETLVGKGLFAAVFANDGQYRLGKEPSEWEGWRMLGGSCETFLEEIKTDSGPERG